MVAAVEGWDLPKADVRVRGCGVADSKAPEQAEPPVAVEDRPIPALMALMKSPMAQAETGMRSEALVFPKKLRVPERAEVEFVSALRWLRTHQHSCSSQRT